MINVLDLFYYNFFFAKYLIIEQIKIPYFMMTGARKFAKCLLSYYEIIFLINSKIKNAYYIIYIKQLKLSTKKSETNCIRLYMNVSTKSLCVAHVRRHEALRASLSQCVGVRTSIGDLRLDDND